MQRTLQVIMVHLLAVCVVLAAPAGAAMVSPELDILARLIDSRSGVVDGANSQYFITQVDLLLAKVEAQLLASLGAMRFLAKAARFGLPTTAGLRFLDNYVLSYDRRLKNPIWSLEYWDSADFRRRRTRRKRLRLFFCDSQLPLHHQATYDDYKGSGYDRGHMVPIGRHLVRSLVYQTFFAINYIPQCRDSNSGMFYRLEIYLDYLNGISRRLYIVTGAVYLPRAGAAPEGGRVTLSHRVIGQSRVGVPSHLYKVFVREDNHGRLSMEAFLIPNCDGLTRHITLEQYRLDIDTDLPELERAVGMAVFDIVDRSKIAKPRTLHGFDEHLQAGPEH